MECVLNVRGPECGGGGGGRHSLGMRHLLEGGIYFTLTVTTSTKELPVRCIVCSWHKIKNKVCE